MTWVSPCPCDQYQLGLSPSSNQGASSRWGICWQTTWWLEATSRTCMAPWESSCSQLMSGQGFKVSDSPILYLLFSHLSGSGNIWSCHERQAYMWFSWLEEAMRMAAKGWHGTQSIRGCRLQLSSASIPKGQRPSAIYAVNVTMLPPTAPKPSSSIPPLVPPTHLTTGWHHIRDALSGQLSILSTLSSTSLLLQGQGIFDHLEVPMADNKVEGPATIVTFRDSGLTPHDLSLRYHQTNWSALENWWDYGGDVALAGTTTLSLYLATYLMLLWSFSRAVYSYVTCTTSRPGLGSPLPPCSPGCWGMNPPFVVGAPFVDLEWHSVLQAAPYFSNSCLHWRLGLVRHRQCMNIIPLLSAAMVYYLVCSWHRHQGLSPSGGRGGTLGWALTPFSHFLSHWQWGGSCYPSAAVCQKCDCPTPPAVFLFQLPINFITMQNTFLVYYMWPSMQKGTMCPN